MGGEMSQKLILETSTSNGKSRLVWDIPPRSQTVLLNVLTSLLVGVPDEHLIRDDQPRRMMRARERFGESVGIVTGVIEDRVLIAFLPDRRDDSDDNSWLQRQTWHPASDFRYDSFPVGSGAVEDLLEYEERSLIDQVATLFSLDVMYEGDEVIGRIRDWYHALRDCEGGDCIVCRHPADGQ